MDEMSMIMPEQLQAKPGKSTGPKQLVPKLDLTKAMKIQEIIVNDQANKQQNKAPAQKQQPQPDPQLLEKLKR